MANPYFPLVSPETPATMLFRRRFRNYRETRLRFGQFKDTGSCEKKQTEKIRQWLVLILAQLEVENSSTICYKIVGILLRSFFPPEEEADQSSTEEKDWEAENRNKVGRCIYLIKQNRPASRKFYRYCDKSYKVHDWVRFMLAILKVLKHFVRKELEERADSSSTLPHSEEVSSTDEEHSRCGH